jgi:hypothetical protein
MNCQECGTTLVKLRDYWGCPNGHGRLIRDEDMQEKPRKPPETPDWKLKLPVAKWMGNVTSNNKTFSIYSIDGKAYYSVDWLDVVQEGQGIPIGETAACVVSKTGVRAVRRFAPYNWLTDDQKKRLSF